MTQILVVDNNPMVLEFFRELLSGEDCRVETSDNGLDALDLVEQMVPDIIFVDLVMPQIDGKQLCTLFRSMSRTKESFIVIISAIAAEERDFDFTAIADAYLAKIPFKKMRHNVLSLVDDVKKGNTGHYRDGIVGLDQIFHRDITEELLFSRKHMEVLLSSISDGFVEISDSFKVIYANAAALDLFGTSWNNLLTSNLPSLFPPATADLIRGVLNELKGEEIVLGEDEEVMLRERYLRLRFNTVNYGDYHSIVVIMQDISRQRQAEKTIMQDLLQKELLLKEVHHRVKNNLNVVASLISLQTSFIEDESAIKHLNDSRNRVESMALIHEKLYHTENLSGIYLDTYLGDLAAHMMSIYSTSEAPVRSYLDIPSIHINIETAVPLGLIINELISNCLEHGFAGQKDGKIEIRFLEHESHFSLLVKDNGKGLPDDFIYPSANTLGLLLVSNLCSQIDGELKMESNHGTEVTISFDKKAGIFGSR
jgi:PAS domain S-box-containing protein